MAQIARVAATISEVLGVNRQTVDNVARRLSEADMLPTRGPRGRHALHFEPIHIVRVLLGTMIATIDALNTPSTKVPAMVRNLQALEQDPPKSEKNEFKVVIEDDEKEMSVIYSNGPFAHVVADFLIAFAAKNAEKVAVPAPYPSSTKNEPRRSPPSIGIRLAGGEMIGFVTVMFKNGNFVQVLYHAQEQELFDALEKGMMREAHISVEQIVPIAALLNRTNGKAPASDQTADE